MRVNYQIDPIASRHKVTFSNVVLAIIVLLFCLSVYVFAEKIGGGIQSYDALTFEQGKRI